MGFISKIMGMLGKDEAQSNSVEEQINKKLGNAVRSIEDAVSAVSSANQDNSDSSTASEAADIPVASCEESNKSFVFDTGDEYFEALITEDEFSGYTIEKKVHPSAMDSSAHPSCFPISYLFSKDGSPVLAVFIMQTNQFRSMIARGTYKILDEKGIPYIRFFKGYRNDRDYVINRIKENL